TYSRLGWEVCATVILLAVATDAFSIRDFVRVGGKRAADEPGRCLKPHPFECPSGQCVPIKYLCDGSKDCADGYDEDSNMCTAATRPPVEETAAFLNAVITAHSPDFFIKVFGPKARNNFEEMGEWTEWQWPFLVRFNLISPFSDQYEKHHRPKILPNQWE
ncbi:hypothetical protein PENTCL1PPCAC_2105, partial [Pristionchus entomophagus]